MKKLLLVTLALSSISALAVSSGSYNCKIVKDLSVKAYEAGPEFNLLVSGNDLTISGKDIDTCSTKAKNTNSDFIKADSAMKDCGIDGVDMLIPLEMKDQAEKSTVIVSANGSFDVYSCKLNAMVEW